VPETDARRFLIDRYGSIEDLQLLTGGFWSTAFSFVHEDADLVIRFGDNLEWFEADQAAVAFASPGLPVPTVLEVGEALGGAFAVSERRYGVKLEEVRPEQHEVAGPTLASLLGALFEVPKRPDLPIVWHDPTAGVDFAWAGWLHDRLAHDPNPAIGNRSAALVGHVDAAKIFKACEARVSELLSACPERRDLVHGDLLHANVLVEEDASRATGVFSWKCSVRGDFLYDVAWCSFWSPWYPGIAAIDPWRQAQREPTLGGDPDAWGDASVRHHCYELHIGATHLGWNVWIDDMAELDRVVHRLDEVYERGPLPMA
jgi:aminoglycoside phosphotransferase (APT) family kinase protein